MNTFNADELELLAAGYVLDDLDEAEKLQVEELLKSSPEMREQIRQSMAVMGILSTDAEPISPPLALKDKVSSAFAVANPSIAQSAQKSLIQLDNWFQQLFDQGWQTVSELLGTSQIAPAFRNSGAEGARLVSLGSEASPVVLVVRVKEAQNCDRDVTVEILPQLKQGYLPTGLRLMLLDEDEDIVMEATTRLENKNLKFDFEGACEESFSIKLELANDYFREDFIL